MNRKLSVRKGSKAFLGAVLSLLLILAAAAPAMEVRAEDETPTVEVTSDAELTAACQTSGKVSIVLKSTINMSEKTIPADADVTLDLNGFTIRPRMESHSAFIVKGNLTITDTSWGDSVGALIGFPVCAIKVESGGTFIFDQGKIINCQGTNGGAIENSGVVLMNGGIIENNTAFNVQTNDDTGYGGGVDNKAGAVFSWTGGKFSRNAANKNGGAVSVREDSTFNISGKLECSGNTFGTSGLRQDVYLFSGAKMTVSGKLTNTEPIVVSTQEKPTQNSYVTLTKGLKGKGTEKNFAKIDSDSMFKIFLDNDGEAVLAVPRLIVFNPNGGSGEMENVIIGSGMTYALPENGFTPPEGKEFLGWRIGTGNSKIYQPGDSNKIVSNISVYPEWHEHDLDAAAEVPADCEHDGIKAHWFCVDSNCGKLFADAQGQTETTEKDLVIEKLGHDWGDYNYEWADDNSSVAATAVCSHNPDHKADETAGVTSETTKEPTCTATGTKKLTAEFENEVFETQTKTEEIPVDPTAHILEETPAGEPDCEHEGYDEAFWHCTECGKYFSDAEGTTEIEKPEPKPASGHDWGDPAYEWADDDSSVTATRVCNINSEHEETEEAEVASEDIKKANCQEGGEKKLTAEFKNEAFETQTKTVETEPDPAVHANLEKVPEEPANCAETGTKAYWKCPDCGKMFSDEAGTTEITEPEEIPVDDSVHAVIEVPEVPATCEKDGTKAYWKCDICGKLFSDEAGTTEIEEPEKIEKTGHDWGDPTYTWSKDNSKCTAQRVCKNDKSHVEKETVKSKAETTKEATTAEPGEKTYTAEFKNEVFETQTKTEEIPKKGITYKCTKGDGSKWTKGSSNPVEFTFERSEAPEDTYKHFTGVQVDGKDVDASNYTAESGSLILKLKPVYLETLAAGTHKVTTVYDDGTGSANLLVVKSTTNKTANNNSGTGASGSAAKTGDTNNILMWFVLMLAAFAAVAGVVLTERKKRNA